MCVTGNNEVSKEILHKNINFISPESGNTSLSLGKDNSGMIFIKRILERIDVLSKIEEIEERFLPDGEKALLIQVVDSLSKGKKIEIKKVKGIEKLSATSSANP
jgi:hypothetical protein